MTLYHVTLQELRTFTIHVEAENEEEAGDLAENNINNYEVVDECITNWGIHDIEDPDA
tara:strand:- start:581 stop:754 length:174 start_codon:yes stop_codon:yes gene_type:complete